jgi:signal transduction histidine kinase
MVAKPGLGPGHCLLLWAMWAGLESLEHPLLNIRRDAISGASSAVRVSEWSVRRKVVAVLAIPVALAAVFGGLRVSTELNAASDYSVTAHRAIVLGPAVDYLTASERLTLPPSLVKAIGTGSGNPVQDFDAASAVLKRAAVAANLTAPQSALVTQITSIGDQIRSGSGAGITATKPVQLSDMERDTTLLIQWTLNKSGTPDPHVEGLVQALNGQLSLTKQQLLIQSSGQQSSLLGSVWLAAEVGVEGSALSNLRTAVGGNRRISTLITVNGTRLGEATTKKVKNLAASPKTFVRYESLNTSLLSEIHGLIATRASASKTRALTDSSIILGALLASLLLALVMARALINPLRRVRNGALDVAHVQLPESVKRIRNGKEPEEIKPIAVHSKEELGQLARAVDDMHRQAVTLATGEAQLRAQVGAMFVTLSRRNTTLVNQQLALIESLEQDEEDPQRLEQLFSLDHLATRMRRTAESLVILGGTQGRTASFEELSVSDVIHAAVSEVQDYQRVRIDAAPERRISGRAASDVVHLLAELIDNALSYSPPGSPVVIQAAEEAGRVEIEIIDTGLGMAGDALAQANEALKQGGEVTVDTARRMGLFVVSRLAEDHGLRVKLRRNPTGGGIIASIALPEAVLASEQPVHHLSLMDAPEVEEAPVAPVVGDQADDEYDPYLERIEEAIAAVTGLPRRRPGANVATEEPPVAEPVAPVSMFATSPELPPAFEPTALPSQLEDVEPLSDVAEVEAEDGAEENSAVQTDESGSESEEPLADVVTPDFGAEPSTEDDDQAGEVARMDESDKSEITENVPADEVVDGEQTEDPLTDDWATEEADESTADAAVAASYSAWSAEPVAQEEAPAEEGELEPAGVVSLAPVAMAADEGSAASVEPMPARLTIRRPLSATPAANALEGELAPDTSEPLETPIFGQLRSNWLSDEPERPWTSNEVERGWETATEAEDANADGRTKAGLPVRRPGGRLVPGGVTTEPAAANRDPEAIRNRLAAHSAGVSRGRAAAGAQPLTDDYAHEETGPA